MAFGLSRSEIRKNALRMLLALSLLGISGTPALASLMDEHVKPTLEHGFDLTGLAILSAGVGAGYAAYTQEDHLRREWGDNQLMSKSQTKPGDFVGTGIVGGAIALGQIFFDSPNGWAHTEALLWTFVTTHGIKYAAHKRRPNGLNTQSMPSGHTSTAFASATHLAYAYGWWAGVPALAVATYTGLSRIADDAHWYSDIVAGATLGIFWARATSNHHSSATSVRLDPWILDDGAMGLRLSYHY